MNSRNFSIETIDLAVTLGLGEPRYRPSPWLARRAQLGLSLTQRDAADIQMETQS